MSSILNPSGYLLIIHNLLLFLLPGCSTIEREPYPVAQVINSMIEQPPEVQLPADAYPEGKDWRGIDLEPKSWVLSLYAEEVVKHFLLPPGCRNDLVRTSDSAIGGYRL